MSVKLSKQINKKRRQKRVRKKISGTAKCPRINVHRSLMGMFVQLIDDSSGKTLVSIHSKTADLKADAGDRTGKVAQAYLLGKLLAEKAKSIGIEQAVFDRAGYKYHGRVQALADGLRELGIKF